MRIQNNIAADNSHRQLGINNQNISKNTEKLSSGLRVNRAADDAAGLAISEKMRTQIRGLNRASLNIQDGVSLLQVGDGALQFVHNKLQRMRELSVQAANDTNQLMDREAIQLEFGQLSSEINQVVQMTNFNGRLLFDGSIGAAWEYNLGRMTAPYTTTIPATGDYSGPIDIAGWNISPTLVNVTVGYTDLHSPSHIFPDEGIFAMQIITPADGTLNVILDFGAINTVNGVDIAPGNMNLDNILTYFRNEFNNMGLGHIVNGISYDPPNQRLVFDFPNDNGVLTGVMGRPSAIATSTTPRVWVGIGSGTLAGSSGADAQRNSLNGTATAWTSQPFRTNKPGMTVNSSTLFANDAFFPNNNTRSLPTGATPPSGSIFPSVTINVNGSPTTISLSPGSYSDAPSFVKANEDAFLNAMPRGFEIKLDDDGKIAITSKGLDSSPSVDIAFNPATLATALGFIGAIDITTEAESGGYIPIQSGANEGDMIEIEIPRLCTRALGISIRRPMDDGDPTSEGFEHINGLGADGYRTAAQGANIINNPYQEYSLDVTTHEKAGAAITVLTNAINIISMERARMGAQQNRLEYSMKNVDNTSENLQAAESRIRDTDMAAEMTIFTKNQILVQASTAMLAQANTLPQGVLQLLS